MGDLAKTAAPAAHKQTAPAATAGLGTLQRKCACGGTPGPTGECEACRKNRLGLQRQAAAAAGPATAPPIVNEVLASPGLPLDGATRSFMETRMGHDFGRVRVHSDGRAAESARAVNALAYTVGRDVVFGAGQYAPGTGTGRRLLAHELAHTVQQGKTVALQHQAIAPSGGRLEQEASAAADAVVANQPVPSLSPAASLVQRQDVNPDAGSATPDAGSATPDAGATTPATGGPTPGTGGPTPAPPVAQSVTDITVANQRAAITYPEPSTAGAGGRKHFVTVAGSGPEVIVEATLSPTGTPASGSVTWTGATPDPSDPSRATVPRARAGKREVTASAGGGSASLIVWAVFVRVTSGGATLNAAPTGAAPYFRRATINFTGTIFPTSITTDPDRPDLEGANTVDPPGGANYCGNDLAGGVNSKWDLSRQIDQEVINPSAIPAPAGPPAGPPCFWDRVAFPANNAVGNDDANIVGENNNPYTGGGVITSRDTPGQSLPDALGADGDTLEFVLRFREFARLEYHRTWWLVSNRLAWTVNFRATKAAGRWVDSGSTATP